MTPEQLALGSIGALIFSMVISVYSLYLNFRQAQVRDNTARIFEEQIKTNETLKKILRKV